MSNTLRAVELVPYEALLLLRNPRPLIPHTDFRLLGVRPQRDRDGARLLRELKGVDEIIGDDLPDVIAVRHDDDRAVWSGQGDRPSRMVETLLFDTVLEERVEVENGWTQTQRARLDARDVHEVRRQPF